MPLYSKVKVGGSRLKEETIISIALSFVEWRSETNFFIHTVSPLYLYEEEVVVMSNRLW
jgi:hypothetical protein